MSILTVTVGGSERRYREVELKRGISPARPTPEATIRNVEGTASTGDTVTIESGTDTLFTGIVARPRIQNGGRDLICEHDLAPLYEEAVDVPPTTSVETALQSALSNASTSATLSFIGADVTLGDDYQATDRPVRRIFRDLTERTGRVWRIEDPGTVVVEPLGAGPTIQIDTSTDTAVVKSFDPGDVRTVVNDVTVNGTGDDLVTGTASDATSISNFGTRSDTVNIGYIRTQAEANNYASELLVPDPLASAEVRVGASATDVVSDRSNATIELTDPASDISNAQLVIEEQTNTTGGSTVFSAGEGARQDLVVRNRQAKSDEDKNDPGAGFSGSLPADSVDTQQLVDTAVIKEKLADAGVTSGKLVDGAVIKEKLADAGVSSGKLVDGSVIEQKIEDTAITRDKIAARAIIGDKIAGRTISGLKIKSESIQATEIDTQTITGNRMVAGAIDTTQLAADAVTANEILANTITAGEITSGTITALEIDSDTITTNEIDTLDLDTDELKISDSTTGSNVNFFGDVNGGIAIEPSGTVALGSPFSDPFSLIKAQQMTPENDDEGSVGSSFNAYSEMTAYEFIDADDGTINAPDGGDPLAGVATGHGPPDSCEVCDDETGETKGYSVNQMAREAWDVVRAQQRRIDDLEARLSALEDDTDPNA